MVEYLEIKDRGRWCVFIKLEVICSKHSENEIPALFICQGYSSFKTGVDGIAVGFTVNNVAIAEYEEATGKTLTYGVFAVSQSKLGSNDVFDKEGNAVKGVINAEITSQGFASFELKIVGFTDEYKDTKLAVGHM